MKNILSEIKSKSLLATLIIAFIIAFFINPLAKLSWNLLFLMTNRLSSFLINQIIDSIIRGNTLIEVYIFIFVFATFMFLFVDPLAVKTKKESTNNKIKKIPVRKIEIICLYLFYIIFIVVITTNIIISELNINFKLKMGIISPYIENEKEEELWSKWYLMESKMDYINLNYELENIAEKNNFKLKKPFK